MIKVEATDSNDGLFTEIEGAAVSPDDQVGEVVLAAFESDGTLLIQRADLEVAREDLAGDMHLGVVIRKALVAGDEELILRQVGVRLQVDAGVELRDVEDAAFVNGNRLEGVVGTPDGGVQTGVVKGHGFVGGLLAVFERDVGVVLQVKVCGNSGLAFLLFSLDLHRVDGAVELEGRLAGCKVNETVDIGLGAEVERRVVDVALHFDGGSALAGGNRAVIRELGAGLVLNEDTVAKLSLLALSVHITHADEAVVDGFRVGGAAEFHAGTRRFNVDGAVVDDLGSRVTCTDAHAVGILGDDLAFIDGSRAVASPDGVVLIVHAIFTGRHIDRALVRELDLFTGDAETARMSLGASARNPESLVKGLILGNAGPGLLGFLVAGSQLERVLVLDGRPIGVGDDRVGCSLEALGSNLPFGSHRRAGHAGDHRRDGSGHDRLRALALHGGRNFIYNHQGAARLVENNLECRIHVNYSFWEEKTNAKVLLRKLRIAKFQGLVLGGGKNPNASK